MQAYTELLPPTAVTHALSIPFTSRKAQNLIVVKTSLLQIFRIKKVEVDSSKNVNGDEAPLSLDLSRTTTNNVKHTKSTQNKLVLVGEYALAGTVTSIAGIKAMNTKSGGHALLVSTKDAKVSLIEWNPEIYSISTISIHYYEGDDLQGAPWAPDIGQFESFLTVDPSNRCAALKFGHRHLAILPFRQPGDDLAMVDYDPDAGEPRPAKTNGETKAVETPYSASFVLPLTALDPSLIHPVDLAFLHEYREPTLGILASAKAPAMSLVQERKDPLTYTVFTLDIEQRARTPLLSVTGLPVDLFKLVPLPLPIGGTLLIGGNELIHVDQSGKTTAIAVNEFAKECSSFSMIDQSELQLRLEHCRVAQIDESTGDMLLVLNSGELAVLGFGLDGRSVNSLSLRRVAGDKGGYLCGSGATCMTKIERGLLFVGCEDSDALLLSCVQGSGTELSKKRSHAEMLGLDEDEEEDDLEDDDDLYGTSTTVAKSTITNKRADAGGDISVETDDSFINLLPSGPPSFAPSSVKQISSEFMSPGLDLVIATGRGSSGALNLVTRSVKPTVVQILEIPGARDVWSLKLVSTPGDSREYDNLLVATHVSDDGTETSSVHSLQDGKSTQRTGTDFESSIATLNAGVICKDTRLVQISHSEVRSYDADLGLSQIYPMVDEETDQELKIIHSHLLDPYVLLIRDDSSVLVLKVDAKGELDEVEKGDVVATSKWLSGCIHKPEIGEEILLYLLNTKGSLSIFQLPNLDNQIYMTDLRNVPSILTANGQARRVGAEQAMPEEILIADIGDLTEKATYMIVRSRDDELTLYQPFWYPTTSASHTWTESLRWSKIASFQPASSASALVTIDGEDNTSHRALRYIDNVGGRSVVLLQRQHTRMIVKEAGTPPQAIQVDVSGSLSFNATSTETCPNAFVSATEKAIVLSQVLSNTDYGTTGWAVNRIPLDEGIENMVYHAETSSYIVSTSRRVDFVLPEDDWHPEWAEEDTRFKPQVDQGAIKLVDATTQRILQEMVFDPEETVLCMKIINLEISEHSHKRKPMIVVGTAKVQGEDYGCGGSIYVFDIIQVVPDPDKPETHKALKLIAREELRGPVTALSEIGDQGFLVHAQGQKCLVRGLKEDNTLLPVAFIDVQTVVTSLKNVKGTGLVLIADALKGVWLAGFAPEPYTIRVFGKSRSRMDVLAADFLPQDKQLFLLVADSDCNIHVLEFNPEDPKSLSGQRLLHRSTFHTGHFPVSMTLLPTASSTLTNPASAPPDTAPEDGLLDETATTDTISNSILMTTQSGALCLITSLDEQTYRRLGALQTHLATVLDHPAGLNPRAYRAVESEGFGGRGMLDGNLLARWTELSSQKKVEACNRVGEEMGVVRGWLEELKGRGLVYL